MRLRLGRPDLTRYADRFDLPVSTGPLGVTFLGVSTLLIDDGASALLTDGYFSRPGLLAVGLGRIAPDEDRIAQCLTRALAGCPTIPAVEAVIPVHSHFDHALDSAVVASAPAPCSPAGSPPRTSAAAVDYPRTGSSRSRPARRGGADPGRSR